MIKERIERVQSELSFGEAFLATNPNSRFYLTNFHSSAGTVLILKDKAFFLIDFRYVEKAKNSISALEVLLSKNATEEIYEILKENDIKNLYIETNYTSVSEEKTFKEAFSGVLVSDSNKMDILLEKMRSVKTIEELSLIKKAQSYTDKTFSYILERIEAGRTEKEIMLDMEFYMRKLGSEGVSFDFIVVSGKNSSLPHGVPTDKKVEKGDFITMDFGAVSGGYRSDMTRTVAVGSVSDEQREVYETVLKAQEEAISAIKAGKVCFDIDKIARDIISEAGFGDCFGHGLGHSVGIEIHENPNFNMRCHEILLPGTVMTVEPGIYLENKFGVRIEDMVYVTEDSCENLTKSPKNLIII